MNEDCLSCGGFEPKGCGYCRPPSDESQIKMVDSYMDLCNDKYWWTLTTVYNKIDIRDLLKYSNCFFPAQAKMVDRYLELVNLAENPPKSLYKGINEIGACSCAKGTLLCPHN